MWYEQETLWQNISTPERLCRRYTSRIYQMLIEIKSYLVIMYVHNEEFPL